MELMAYVRREWLWKQPENNQKEKQLIYWEVYVYLRPFTGCGLNLKTNKQSQSKKQTNKQKIQKTKKTQPQHIQHNPFSRKNGKNNDFLPFFKSFIIIPWLFLLIIFKAVVSGIASSTRFWEISPWQKLRRLANNHIFRKQSTDIDYMEPSRFQCSSSSKKTILRRTLAAMFFYLTN